MAWRLRNSGVSSMERVHAIGVDAGIALVELDRLILPVLDQLGWVRINRAADGALVSVDAVLPPPIELIALATSVMNINMPTPVGDPPRDNPAAS